MTEEQSKAAAQAIAYTRLAHDELDGVPASRDLAMVRTKLDEAELWAQRLAR